MAADAARTNSRLRCAFTRGRSSGRFEPTLRASASSVHAIALRVDRPPALSFLGTGVDGARRGASDLGSSVDAVSRRTPRAGDDGAGVRCTPTSNGRLVRIAWYSDDDRVAVDESLADAIRSQELVYLVDRCPAPGYDYHSTRAGARGFSEHVEWRMPDAVPGVLAGTIWARAGTRGRLRRSCIVASRDCIAGCGSSHPAVVAGCASLVGRIRRSARVSLPFDLLRIDVARGFARGGTLDVQHRREPGVLADLCSTRGFRNALAQC